MLSAGLHSDAASAWIHALQREEVLERIMWIAANTMNSQLREKVCPAKSHLLLSSSDQILIYRVLVKLFSYMDVGGVNSYVSLLLLQSTELILAIVDSKQEALSALLPTLLGIGLPGLLTDLIESEVTAITEGTSTCGSECSPSTTIFSDFLFCYFFSFVESLQECILTGALILLNAGMLY